MTMGSAFVAGAVRRVEAEDLELEAKYLDAEGDGAACLDGVVRGSWEEAGLEPGCFPPKKVESEACPFGSGVDGFLGGMMSGGPVVGSVR
jgi:hypothetical protein